MISFHQKKLKNNKVKDIFIPTLPASKLEEEKSKIKNDKEKIK